MLKAVKNSQAYGNEEVVSMLESWLKEAKKGKVCHATITTQQMPNLMACTFAGSADLEYAVPFALDTLKLKIWETARMHSGPVPKEGVTADYVCYNLGSNPISFDFLPWLIDAEMTRVREGAPSPLKIAFTMGQGGESGLNNAYRRIMYTGVVRPLLSMIGAVETKDATFGRHNPMLTLKGVTDAARRGEAVPKLKAPAQAMTDVAAMLAGGPAPVTITLRELDTWKHRNSNLKEWLKFADDLEKQGERVIFLRDTAKAGEPLLNRETSPLASTNLHVRMALYEQAKINLFVPNGPWNLQLFGTRPWLMFNEVSESDPYFCNTPKFWSESQGIEEGTQFPWSAPDQRIIWKADTYKNISEAWHGGVVSVS